MLRRSWLIFDTARPRSARWRCSAERRLEVVLHAGEMLLGDADLVARARSARSPGAGRRAPSEKATMFCDRRRIGRTNMRLTARKRRPRQDHRDQPPTATARRPNSAASPRGAARSPITSLDLGAGIGVADDPEHPLVWGEAACGRPRRCPRPAPWRGGRRWRRPPAASRRSAIRRLTEPLRMAIAVAPTALSSSSWMSRGIVGLVGGGEHHRGGVGHGEAVGEPGQPVVGDPRDVDQDRADHGEERR